MAKGYLKAAYESIPGNETNSPTLSTKTIYPPLISFDPDPGVSHLDRDDELRDSEESPQLLPEMKAPKWSLGARLYPDLLGFMLKLILGNPVTTAGNGVITDPDGTVIPAGAHRHVWTSPFGPSGASPLTAEWIAAYKDQAAFYKLKGSACEALSITTPESGGGRMEASGPTLYLTDIADPALTAAFESLSVRPFMRQDLQIVTWLTGSATFEDFDAALANPVVALRTLGISSEWPDVMEKGDGPIVITGSVPKRAIDPDDYTALKNATGFGTKARWKSKSIITGSYPYTFWIEHDNAQYFEGKPNPLENKRRLGASFRYKATSDGAGAASTITLVNATASYA